MAGISNYSQKQLVDYIMLGASPSRPAALGMGLSLGAPSASSASEVATGSGWTRQSLVMAAAASPAGSASNASAVTFGPALTAAVFTGGQVWDNATPGSGNMLIFGNLATVRTLGVGDSLVIPAGSFTFAIA